MTPHDDKIDGMVTNPIQYRLRRGSVYNDCFPVHIVAENTVSQALQVVSEELIFTLLELLMTGKHRVPQIEGQFVEASVQNRNGSVCALREISSPLQYLVGTRTQVQWTQNLTSFH
jgi:hypothetical protein